MKMTAKYFLLSLCVLVGVCSALPHQSNGKHNETAMDATNATGRQARFSLSPSNLAYLKTALDGAGASALASLFSVNISNLVFLSLLAGTAFLLAPIVLNAFGFSSFGALGRSLGLPVGRSGNETQGTMTANVYRFMDDFFRDYNIDAASCMQRFACSTARKAAVAQQQGNPSYFDMALNYVIGTSYVKTTLGHSKFADALTFGEKGGSCEIEYGKCPFSWEKVAKFWPVKSNAIPNTPLDKEPQY